MSEQGVGAGAPGEASASESAPLPAWLDQLKTNFLAGVAHMYALTLNVADYVPYAGGDDPYQTLKQFLRSHLFRGKRLVIFFDRSSGITFGGATPEETARMEDEFRKLSGLTRHEDSLRMEPSLAIDTLEQVLTMPPAKVKELLGKDEGEFPKGAIVVVVGFAETIAPAGDVGNMNPNDRTNIVTLARWARSKVIEEREYLVVLLTMNEADLASHLRNAAADIVSIRVPLPKIDDRKAFIASIIRRRREIIMPDGTDEDVLARASAGLSLRMIEDIVRLGILAKAPLDVEWIWQHKKAAIERMCGGLLEVVRPVWTFDHVGGLSHVKRYLQEVAGSIRAGRVIAVPQGIIFLGPPGTGKTIMAEALANGLGFPMLKLRNIREMWHGNTERNQSLVFDLIEELAPVVVFEDEIDQQEQARGTAFHGDGGISARLLARKLAFLSDTRHRGRVLWIAASNRPDLIDPAMLRPGRFDTKIPFLLPTKEERPDIVLALTRKLTRHAMLSGFPVTWVAEPGTLATIAEQLDGYSGAELELVLTRAIAYAGRDHRSDVRREDVEWARHDFIRSRAEAEYESMTLHALRECNSLELLPPEYHDRARIMQTIEGLARMMALDGMLKGEAIPTNIFDPKNDPKIKA
ncbi:ATP-binding protein [Candidatus Uhrbacteria bacterium]|nr:ATP-binding protein [Candidatus Uhrbacteria bacterium]